MQKFQYNFRNSNAKNELLKIRYKKEKVEQCFYRKKIIQIVKICRIIFLNCKFACFIYIMKPLIYF